MNHLIPMLIALPLAVSAATITVDSAADDVAGSNGRCTLREAISNVNAGTDTTGGDCAAATGSGDTIDFTLTLPDRIRLRLGHLQIERDVIIRGPVTGLLQVWGTRETAYDYGSRVFFIAAGSTTMSDLTVAYGNPWPSVEGGGILVGVSASLTLNHCAVASNVAVDLGGGILNDGVLVVNDSTLFNNQAYLREGAGLYNRGSATLTRSSISFNNAWANGGGIVNQGTMVATSCDFVRNEGAAGAGVLNRGTATFRNCLFRGNGALFGPGGGLYTDGTAEVTDSSFIDNRAAFGGALQNSGMLTLRDSTVSRNWALLRRDDRQRRGQGGGVDNSGTAVIDNCTLSRNQARTNGGAVHNSGSLTMRNCTLYANKAKSSGGGVLNSGGATGGMITLTNCTLAKNVARLFGGVAHEGQSATLTNTILANRRNCGGSSLISGGHNLSSDSTCFTPGTSNLLDTDPRLGRLANHGGATDTLALCIGVVSPEVACRGRSSAVDGGDDIVTGAPENLTTDQRGQIRPAGLHVDIGAYESQ